MEIYRKENLPASDRVTVERAGRKTVYRLSNDTGTGCVTQYDLFEDVAVLFDDMHLYTFEEGSQNDCALIIEHCRQGRFEADLRDGHKFYLGPGDVCLHNMDYQDLKETTMPIRHYHGITVVIRSARDPAFRSLLEAAEADLGKLAVETRTCGGVRVFRADEKAAAIFEEMYRADPEKVPGLYRLKTAELLLALCGARAPADETVGCTLRSEVADLIKRVELYLWEHLADAVTIPQLARHFGICDTLLKQYFRILYGRPVHEYYTECRMQFAAWKLVRTEEKIGDIARQVGFRSGSKFSEAFARFSGKSPREYRKAAVLPDWDIISPLRTKN